MRALKNIFLLMSLAAAGFPIAAGAQQAAPQDDGIALAVTVWEEETVTNAKGEPETRRIEAASIVPGDIVIYRVTYTNQGAQAAENVIITNPIPEHMVYQDGSAAGENAQITFSVNGGQSYGEPGTLTVPGETGAPRRAQAGDYTHIRWQISRPIPPNSQGFVEYRALLE